MAGSPHSCCAAGQPSRVTLAAARDSGAHPARRDCATARPSAL